LSFQPRQGHAFNNVLLEHQEHNKHRSGRYNGCRHKHAKVSERSFSKVSATWKWELVIFWKIFFDI
ncbi:MAG: hypothetical protein KJ687_04035, partial [Proteobacteria bacterium]|nr:hypothetical protein [Pseudomonadota bacterium]